MRKILMLCTPALVVILALAATSQKSTSPDANAVKIDNFTFSPATLTVSPGTAVRWTNKDDVPHTVVSTEKAFKSSTLDTDEGFTYTFTKPGTYNYFCSIHPKMTATVLVK